MLFNNKKAKMKLRLYVTTFVIWFVMAGDGFCENSQDFSRNLVQGQMMLKQGLFYQALDLLEKAENQAATSDEQALVFGSMGFAQYQLGHDKEAESLLNKAIASTNAPRHEKARWNAMLAKIILDQGKQDEAQLLFSKALILAADDQELTSALQLQQIEILPVTSKLTKLKGIYDNLAKLKVTPTKSRYLLKLAAQAHQVGKTGQELAYKALMEAKSGANTRQLAEIDGELAQLYEDDQRYGEALKINQTALTSLLNQDAPELTLALQWRQGRLHNYLNRVPEALAAYQRAIDQIETIRHDIPVIYRNGESSFRTTLAPLYQQMTGLLLAQAKQHNDSGKAPLLRRARSVAELVKQAELEDFLGGRCAVHPVRKALLEAVEPRTAIIYPIMLPDRLELLVSIGDQIHQFSSAVDIKSLRRAVYQYVGALRSAHPDEKSYATPIYRWLIQPLQALLQAQNVQTLVIVPDSFLRLVPFAALYDGKHYLVEDYAVSTSPGISIIEPSGIKPLEDKALIVGLSEPGNVIHHLPESLTYGIQGSLVRGSKPSGQPKSRGLDIAPGTEQNLEIANTVHSPAQQFDENIKTALSLPGVVTEIAHISPMVSGTVLLNQDFTVDRFQYELMKKPYALVHIASHLISGSNSASSYLMAYDNIINFDQLEILLKRGKFANHPIEMLTLSACQTAEGDDRAPLGLSGLALKAKVRSALGTLWPVNDEAAPLLMAAFYHALSEKGTSKTEALRQAQQDLLKMPEYKHPFYWAPYILVGNWL